MIFEMHDVNDKPVSDKKTTPESNYLVRIVDKEDSKKIRFCVMEFRGNGFCLINGHFDFDMLSMYNISHWVRIENQ